MPFLDLHHDHTLTHHVGALVLSVPATLQNLYAAQHPPPAAALPFPGHAAAECLTWEQLVLSNSLSPSALRLAALLRAAPLFPTVPGCPFRCRLCDVPCPGWGTHLLSDCPLLPLALLHGFHCAASQLQHLGYPTAWETPTVFRCSLPAHPDLRWTLCADVDLRGPALPPASAFITWSGLLWLPPAPGLPSAVRQQLIVAFLDGADEALTACRDARWDVLQRCSYRLPEPAASPPPHRCS